MIFVRGVIDSSILISYHSSIGSYVNYSYAEEYFRIVSKMIFPEFLTTLGLHGELYEYVVSSNALVDSLLAFLTDSKCYASRDCMLQRDDS